MFGANSAIRSTTASPNASRWSSQRPELRRQLVRRVLDEAADHVLAGRRHRRVDERRDDHVDVRLPRRIGRTSRRRRPCSISSIDGQNEIAPRRCSPAPGRHVKSGRRSTARFTLPDEPRNLNRRTSSSNDGVERARLEQTQERPPRVDRREDDVGADLLAGLEHDAAGATAAGRGCARPAPPSGSPRPRARAAAADRVRDRRRCRPSGCPTPGTRRRSRPCSGGAARRPFPGDLTPWNVPMIPDAAIVALSGSVSNHWSRKSEALIVMSWTNTACWRSGSRWKRRASAPSGSIGRGSRLVEVGRHDAEDRLDEAGHLDHQLAVFLVRLGVRRRPATELADRPAVVVDAPQVVASAARGPSPGRNGVNVPSSGRMSRPCLGSSRSRMISGRSSDTT